MEHSKRSTEFSQVSRKYALLIRLSAATRGEEVRTSEGVAEGQTIGVSVLGPGIVLDLKQEVLQ